MLTLDAVEEARDISGTSFTRREASDMVRETEVCDVTEERRGMLSERESVEPALLVLARPPATRFCQEVGGNDERAFGVLVLLLVERSRSLPSSSTHVEPLIVRDAGCEVERTEETEGWRERLRDEIRRVRAEGASSSSLKKNQLEEDTRKEGGTWNRPVAPAQTSGETNTTAEESPVPMTITTFRGIPLILQSCCLGTGSNTEDTSRTSIRWGLSAWR